MAALWDIGGAVDIRHYCLEGQIASELIPFGEGMESLFVVNGVENVLHAAR